MAATMVMAILLFYVILNIIYSGVTGDPCKSHKPLPGTRFGIRNERCSSENEAHCDYYLQDHWYVAKEPSAIILNHCPTVGKCGATYPAWMNGTFPAVADGVVTRKACVLREGECCKDNVTIKVKNCSGFYVYHLKSLKECLSAYCFESSLPCEALTTTTAVPTETHESKDNQKETRESKESKKETRESKESKKETRDSKESEKVSDMTIVIVICTVCAVMVVGIISAASVGLYKYNQNRRCSPECLKAQETKVQSIPIQSNQIFQGSPPPPYTAKDN